MTRMTWLHCAPLLLAALLVQPVAAQAPFSTGDPILLAGSEVTDYMRPTWSPGGDRVAFAGAAFSGLYVVDVETRQVTRLTDEAGAGFGAEWSHDGAAILTRVSPQEGTRRQHAVKLYEVGTGQELQLTDYRESMRSLPRWAPDGASVLLPDGGRVEVLEARAAVASKAADPTARITFAIGDVLAAASLSDPTPRELMRAEHDLLRVTASADGARVAYEVLGGNLFVANADGSSQIDLGRGEAARFSPDGAWVVYMRTQDDGHHITGADLWVARTSDGQAFQLTDTTDRFEMNPDWSPDGHAIVYDDRGSLYLLPLQP
jgi:Tol biopolymer transport system component